MRRWRRLFAEEFVDAVAATRLDLAQGHQDAALRRLHKLRGSASALGYTEVNAMAQDLTKSILTGGAVESGLQALEVPLEAALQTGRVISR
jgi:HPt (histidine-containing phosphotransfer) domain-containing protein